jgi:predicted nucleic acid-binding protein
MIHLDTSVLVDAFTSQARSAPDVRALLEAGEILNISAIVLFEWLRGPRRQEELVLADAMLPRDRVAPFGQAEAEVAARLYTRLRRARGREIDLAIASCALTKQAKLWTLNRADFADIPGLALHRR